MAVNFQALGPLQPKQQMAPQPLPSNPGGGGGGIGGIFKALAGVAGGFENAAPEAPQSSGTYSGPSTNPGSALQSMQFKQDMPFSASTINNPNIKSPADQIAKYAQPGVNMQINPDLSSKLSNVMADMEKLGYKPVIASGARTIEEQREKVKQGFSKTMNSNHLHGNAVDIVDSRYMWNDKKYGKEISKYAQDLSNVSAKYGLSTGMSWKSYGPNGDFAHVQYQPNQTSNQPSQNVPNKYVNLAVTSAGSVYQGNPTMAGVAAAQAILESGLAGGKPSKLAAEQNNYFGIKGKGSAGGANYASAEYGSGGWSKPTSTFAAYNSPTESFQAHQRLMQNPRYKSVLEAKTVEEAAYALQKSGYATDPKYAAKLIQIYNTYVKPYQQGGNIVMQSEIPGPTSLNSEGQTPLNPFSQPQGPAWRQEQRQPTQQIPTQQPPIQQAMAPAQQIPMQLALFGQKPGVNWDILSGRQA